VEDRSDSSARKGPSDRGGRGTEADGVEALIDRVYPPLRKSHGRGVHFARHISVSISIKKTSPRHVVARGNETLVARRSMALQRTPSDALFLNGFQATFLLSLLILIL